MAEVFLAVMEGAQGFRRRCVVKRIRPEKARSAYYTQMFVDEARITAALHHPNIVQVYEFGEIGDLLFLTMEYLDGKNLATVLDSLQARERLMRQMLAAHIAQQVARGLHHAHTATDAEGRPLGVIHRDMSPTNVMLLRTGEVKILDFGVAQAERALKEGATTVGRVKGKLPYMAPEQHSGYPLDCRADLFSVGVMLWEMLTGEILLSEPHGRERNRRVMAGNAPPPSELRPEVPAALDAVVLRCLQPNAELRHPSAAALADDLGLAMGERRVDSGELVRLVEEMSQDPEQPAPDRVLAPADPSDSEGVTLRGHRWPPRRATAPLRARHAAVAERTEHHPPLTGTAQLWRRPMTLAAALGLVALAGLLVVVVQARRASGPDPRPPQRAATIEISTLPAAPPDDPPSLAPTPTVPASDSPGTAPPAPPPAPAVAKRASPPHPAHRTGGRGRPPGKRAASAADRSSHRKRNARGGAAAPRRNPSEKLVNPF
jgi:serine/threonine-protein kinase